MTKNTLTFDQWMSAVDEACENICGVSVHDLANFPFRDSFDDGYSARSTARAAIKAQGDY